MMRNYIFVALVVLLSACGDAPKTELTKDKKVIKPQYAKGFEIQEFADGSFDVVIFDPTQSQDTLQIIHRTKSPAIKLAVSETSHLAFIGRLHHLSDVLAVDFEGVEYNMFLKKKMGGMRLVDLFKYEEVDVTVVKQVDPDLFFVTPQLKLDSSEYGKQGIQCVKIAAHMEAHPLGRAEWLKVFGYLLGEREKAERYFNEIATGYDSIANLLALRKFKKPLVMVGGIDLGLDSWMCTESNLIMTQLLQDAGASNMFQDQKTFETLKISEDSIAAISQNADYIGIMLAYHEKFSPPEELFTSKETWLAASPANKQGKLFYMDYLLSDYHVDGILEPHVMLQDLMHIFHPDVIKGTGKYFENYNRRF